jgi:hypothetical protein
MLLVTRTPRTLEIDHSDFTNRVCLGHVCGNRRSAHLGASWLPSAHAHLIAVSHQRMAELVMITLFLLLPAPDLPLTLRDRGGGIVDDLVRADDDRQRSMGCSDFLHSVRQPGSVRVDG